MVFKCQCDSELLRILHKYFINESYKGVYEKQNPRAVFEKLSLNQIVKLNKSFSINFTIK